MALFPGAASAQDDVGTTVSNVEGTLQTITVTATRRETNVQDVPLAITAIDGSSLRDAGIVNPEDLSGLAPTLHVDQGLSASQMHVSIRGISASGFNVSIGAPIATYIDDVYQPFQWGSATQIFDMNRIEVLRGPQGTLFGKNATGGALAFFSQTPRFDNEGYVTLDVGGGDFTHYAVEAVGNFAPADNLAVRLSGRYSGRNSYIDNIATSVPLGQDQLGAEDNYSFRGQVRWQPTDSTNINLKFHYAEYQSDGAIYWTDEVFPDGAFASFFAGVDLPAGVREVGQEIESFEKFDNRGVTLSIEQEIGSATLTSISNWQKGSFGYQSNDDGTEYTLSTSFQGAEIEQYSQELRLATDPSKSLRALVGGFYQHDDMVSDQGYEFFGDYGGSLQNPETDAWAVFGSLTYDLTEQLSATGGIRYSKENKSHYSQTINFATNTTPTIITRFDDALRLLVPDPATSLCYGVPCFETDAKENSWDSVTWDAALNYKPNEDVLLYARVATGFRSGNLPYRSAAIGTAEPKIGSIDPEKVTAFEVGFKTEWFDRTLRLNGAVHYSNYTDLQLQVTSPAGIGTELQNAGKARIKGGEIELEYAPTREFTLYSSLGYLDATYTAFVDETSGIDHSGNVLPYAPEWTANAGFNYSTDIGGAVLGLASDWRYKSRIFFDSLENPNAGQGGYLAGSARVFLEPEDMDLTIAVYVDNITNEEIRSFQFHAFGRTLAPAIYQPKRTWGVRVTKQF